MKIKVAFTVEVDETAWRDEYGVEDVRADVQKYVENSTNAFIDSLGLGVSA